MSTLIYIGLLGVFAYNSIEVYKNFRGISTLIKTVIGLIGNIGYIAHVGFLIWSFWHFSWWWPVCIAIATMIVGGLSAIVFQRGLIGILISPILTVVFFVLSIIGVLAM